MTDELRAARLSPAFQSLTKSTRVQLNRPIELLTPIHRVIEPRPTPTPAPGPAPAPAQPESPAPAPPAAVAAPPPPATAPGLFDRLPFPQAGDRIRAEDVRTLSQALRAVFDAVAVSSALVGRRFGEARLALVGQQYRVERAVTVFGTELDDPNDPSLDGRLVLLVTPMVLGEPRVAVILSEAVDTRRMTPNLLGLTHGEAVERLSLLVGDADPTGPPVPAPDLVGLTLDQAVGSSAARQ